MKQQTIPTAVQDCHALLAWIIPQLDKFPRLRRYTLGERIESGLLEVLERLVVNLGCQIVGWPQSAHATKRGRE